MGYLAQRKKKIRDNFLFRLSISIIAILSFIGMEEFQTWQLDIINEARLQYFYISIVIFIIALLKLRISSMILSLLLAIFNFAVISSAVPFFYENQSNSNNNSFSIMFHDVNKNNTNYNVVINNIKDKQPDLIIITEASLTLESQLAKIKNKYPYQFNIKNHNNTLIYLLSKFNWIKSGEIKLDKKNKALWADFIKNNHKFSIIGADIVTKWTDNRNIKPQINKLSKFINSKNDPVILTASLSSAPWSKKLYKLKNVAQMEYRGIINPTWPSSFPWFLRIPVDQIYSHKGIFVTNVKLGDNALSDHKSLTADVSFPQK